MTHAITRFADIPQITRSGNYEVDVAWGYLEQHLESFANFDGGLDLDPIYQRGHVWNETQQRRYVEWCLRGGTSGRLLLFNCTTWSSDVSTPIERVDGKQRLEAVRKFMRNELRVFGSLHRDFSDSLRLVKDRFRFQVNDLRTHAEVLQWYLDHNSGVAHSEEELARVRGLLEAEWKANNRYP